MIEFEQTTDPAIINKVFLDPLLWKLREGTTDDPPDIYKTQPGVVYLAMYRGGDLVGIVSYSFFTFKVINVHISILPKYWGAVSREAGATFIRNVGRQNLITKIIVTVPNSCKHIKHYVTDLGLKKEARVKNAIVYNNKVQDIIIYSKELK